MQYQKQMLHQEGAQPTTPIRPWEVGRPLTCLPTLVLRASEQEMQLSFHVPYPWFEFNKGQVTDYTDNNFSSSFS